VKKANFLDKLEKRLVPSSENVAIVLAPKVTTMPLPVRVYDEPFLPFGKSVINATIDLVAAYIFDFASYSALGAAGMIALERTLAYASDAFTIAHGPFCYNHYSVLTDDTSFGFDAITVLSPFVGEKTETMITVVGEQDVTNEETSLYYPKDKLIFHTGGQSPPIVIVDLGEATTLAGQGHGYLDVLRSAVNRRVSHK
jgi:hypothetical protein